MMEQVKIKANFYDEKSIRKNLKKVWKEQTQFDYEEGEIWYQTAHNIAETMAKIHGVPKMQLIGNIAALSPMTSWDDNLNRVRIFYEENRIVHFGTQQEKVKAITSLVNPKEEDIRKILNGDKTVNFFDSILNPSCKKPYCIDRWMIRAALNTEVTNITEGQYRFLKEVFLKESKAKKLIGSQHQAIVWCTMRNR